MLREIPLQTRSASFQPATLDKKARTVEVVWSTGASVRRIDWWTGKTYHEELSLADGDVDLARLNAGAPLLAAHKSRDLSDVIGVVERAWIADGEARASVRFSEREDVQPIIADVQSGILRNVSVGYAVRKYHIEEGDVPVYRAVDWEPMELSMVPIGADAGAGVRAAQPLTACVFETRAQAPQPETGREMPTEDKTAVAVDLDAVRAEAAIAERARVSEISALCERHGLADLRASLVDGGATVDAARAKILETLATRDLQGTQARAPHVTMGADERDYRRSGIEEALLHRASPGQHKLTDNGRQYRGLSLLELGREVLEREGVSTRGFDKMQLAQRALATSDFPGILANVANKTLRAGYEMAPRTFLPWASRSTAPDFKTIQRSAMGDAPTLQKVNEHGEFTVGTIGEGKETYQLVTYGRIVAVTRQVIINDDLGAFADIPRKFGFSAATLESDVVWAVLTANAALVTDSTAIFHANHGNLTASGTAISVDSLGVARALMRKQTSIDGRYINVTPKFLLVPAAKETIAQQYTSQAYMAAQGSNINPFAGTLQVIAEPRLDAASGTAWYLAADPMQVDTIEYCYLDGQDGVYIESRNGFEVDGLEIKARLDFAAKALDFRGLYKNVGA
jgi:hypothetical protein